MSKSTYVCKASACWGQPHRAKPWTGQSTDPVSLYKRHKFRAIINDNE